jgi:hypothetical protein
MIQTIGLIIVVYAIVRLLQSPFTMAQASEPIPFTVRLIAVSLTSLAGVLALVVLTSFLFESPQNIHEILGQSMFDDGL